MAGRGPKPPPPSNPPPKGKSTPGPTNGLPKGNGHPLSHGGGQPGHPGGHHPGGPGGPGSGVARGGRGNFSPHPGNGGGNHTPPNNNGPHRAGSPGPAGSNKPPPGRGSNILSGGPPQTELPTPPGLHAVGPPDMALPSLPPVSDLPPLPTTPPPQANDHHHHGGGPYVNGHHSPGGGQPPSAHQSLQGFPGGTRRRWAVGTTKPRRLTVSAQNSYDGRHERRRRHDTAWRKPDATQTQVRSLFRLVHEKYWEDFCFIIFFSLSRCFLVHSVSLLHLPLFSISFSSFLFFFSLFFLAFSLLNFIYLFFLFFYFISFSVSFFSSFFSFDYFFCYSLFPSFCWTPRSNCSLTVTSPCSQSVDPKLQHSRPAPLQKRMSEDNIFAGFHNGSPRPLSQSNNPPGYPTPPFGAPREGGGSAGPLSASTPPAEGEQVKEKKTRKLMAMGGNLRDKIKTRTGKKDRGDKVIHSMDMMRVQRLNETPHKEDNAATPSVSSPISVTNVRTMPNGMAPLIMGMPMPMGNNNLTRSPEDPSKSLTAEDDGKSGRNDGSGGRSKLTPEQAGKRKTPPAIASRERLDGRKRKPERK